VLVTEVGTSGGRLPLLVTHFSYRMEHGFVRERQALAIADVLEKVISRGDDVLPAVVMGDLNASPDASEIRFLLGLQVIDGRSAYLADCFGETGEGPGYTFDGRHNLYAAPWHERPRRIDYILVRGPDSKGRGKPVDAEVVLTEVHDGVVASDHYGVFATIRF
jgi:endonuclease/exonuclease/phosphatase family metal-dependent hydrolase